MLRFLHLVIETAEINFVYGSNGTGKTTISRVIADCASHAHCSLVWRGASPMELLVYNRDFVERNFNQPDELKGIFTLGEKDKDTLDKIDAAKAVLDGSKRRSFSTRACLTAKMVMVENAANLHRWRQHLKKSVGL